MRSLSPDEQALWARVAATIKPLSRERISKQDIHIKGEKIKISERLSPRVALPVVSSSVRPINERTLDGGWDRRLSSGRVEPDRVIDLHGHNLDQAWRAMDRGLDQALAKGDRIILLVTGHHRPGDRSVERGKIRAVVNDWLAASRHGSNIAAIRGAHRRHGGGGSLYVILRRQ